MLVLERTAPTASANSGHKQLGIHLLLGWIVAQVGSKCLSVVQLDFFSIKYSDEIRVNFIKKLICAFVLCVEFVLVPCASFLVEVWEHFSFRVAEARFNDLLEFKRFVHLQAVRKHPKNQLFLML